MYSKWDEIFKDGGVHVKPTPDLQKLIPLLKKEKVIKILDAGCGNGRDSIYLAKKKFKVYAIDSSKNGILAAKKNSIGLNIDYRIGSLTNLPYKNNFFDFYLAGHSIEYTGKNIKKAVKELKRVLKKNGLIYIRVLSTQHPFFNKKPNQLYGKSVLGYAIKQGIPVKFFSEEELRELFKDFKIIKAKHIKHKTHYKTKVALNEWVLLGSKK